MNIQKAIIYKLDIPLKKPFRTSFGELKNREILFLRLYDKSGIQALGESANLELPIYEPDFNDATIVLLKNYVLPLLFKKTIQTIDELETIYAHIRGNNFTKSLIDAAYWDFMRQKTKKTLRELWGGTKKNIPAAISIGLGTDLNSSIDRVLRYIETYHPKRAKIKIRPSIDVQLIKAIRKKYPTLPLFVDANAAYRYADHNIFKQLDTMNLLMIEQPFAYNDLVEHATLQKEIQTPICLDESISNYHAAEQAIALHACKIFNIKPQRVGGYWQAKKISELAQRHSIPVWCGGMIEAGWGQLFNCSIATLPNFIYENDICLTKWYLADDILQDPIEEKDGIIHVSSTDSLFAIDEKKFKRFTVEKISVNPR